MTTAQNSDVVAAGEPQRRVPGWWEGLTTALLLATAILLVTTVVRLAVSLWGEALARQLVEDPSGANLGAVRRFYAVAVALDLAFGALFILYLVTYVVWSVLSTRLLRKNGRDPKKVWRHWTVTGWRIAAVISFVLSFCVSNIGAPTDSTADLALRLTRFLIAQSVLRLAVAAFLMGAIWVLRPRVRAELALSTVAPRPSELFSREPTSFREWPLGVAAPRDYRRMADAAFWGEVGELVRSHGPDLPLLESWGRTVRRWHLLSSDVDVATVRGTLTAGAEVTVYRQPPRAADERELARVAGRVRALIRSDAPGGTAGLIEEPGVARYDNLSTEEHLLAWQQRARTAPRAAAYPVPATAEAALSAVVAESQDSVDALPLTTRQHG